LALNSIIRKQYALAAFNLHQCAEQCLTSVVYNKCGYRPATHNLLLLYRYACWFEPLLHELFTPQQLAADSLLHLLQKAYTGSRYTNEYVIKGRQIELIKEKIEVLLQRSSVQLVMNV
jgi:HEPN domain-containing protein